MANDRANHPLTILRSRGTVPNPSATMGSFQVGDPVNACSKPEPPIQNANSYSVQTPTAGGRMHEVIIRPDISDVHQPILITLPAPGEAFVIHMMRYNLASR